MDKIYIFPLISSLCYGLVPSIQTFALNKGTSASIVVPFCYICGLILLTLLMFKNKINFSITLKDLGLFFCFGAMLFCTDFLLNTAYTYISVGFTTSLHFIYPTLICLFGCLFLKDKFNIRKFLGIVLSLTGLTLICLKEISLDPAGIIIAICSAFFYSLYLMAIEKFMSEKYEPVKISFYVTSVSLSFSVINAITFTGKQTFNSQSLIFCLIAGYILIIGNVCLNEGIKRLGSYKASFFEILEPIISVIASVIFFKTKMSIFGLLGMLLIISSLIPIFLDKEKNKT